MKIIKILVCLVFANITVFSQITNFNYTRSKVIKIKIDGLDNVEKARYIDIQLLKSDNIIFASTNANEFITTVIADESFSFEKIKKIVFSQNLNCTLLSNSDFNNSIFEQIYSSVNFSKETKTVYGILKKYYTNDKIKDELNFAKYQEIIGLKK